ncbi:MAG TPA: transporter associated domain-containing protein [Acidimicrobiales bacterium]|nr:transporter associated domain-containing protein [Acidimicrobiales bacterium]
MADDPEPDRRARRKLRRGAPIDDPADVQERLIVERLGDLRTTELTEVMTPRVDVTFLSMPVTPEAVADAIRDSGHRAFPVAINDELDQVDGVLFVSDLFRSSKPARSFPTSLPDTTEISRKVRRPPLLLPESMGVLEALAEMRAQRRTFAVVLDEYGGVAGVATLRDLLEPLVGDLSDEFDEDEEPDFTRIDANRWLIDGQAAIDEVAEHLGVELPEGDYVTIGGYVLERLDRIPEPGDSVLVDGWELRVQSMERRRITEIVARRVIDAASAPSA